jgi:hypothetical protein
MKEAAEMREAAQRIQAVHRGRSLRRVHSGRLVAAVGLACFLGGPLSGKTALARRLVDWAVARGIQNLHLSTGEILRRAVRKRSHPAWLQVDTYMRDGQPVPDDIVCEILGKVVEKFRFQSPGGTVILDGFPFTSAQASALAVPAPPPPVRPLS